jgi:hypothetical protein
MASKSPQIAKNRPRHMRMYISDGGLLVVVNFFNIYISGPENTLTNIFFGSQLNSLPDETIILSGRSQVTLGDELI